MKKVQIFTAGTADDLTTKVNDFLNTIDTSNVVFQLTESSEEISCLIVYNAGPVTNVARGFSWWWDQVLAEIKRNDRLADHIDPEEHMDKELAFLLKYYLLGKSPIETEQDVV